MQRPVLRIGDIASRAGVSTRSLRYYEEQQLLTAERTPSGQRVYDATAVDRVRFIQQLFAAGLSSRTILSVLPCVESGHASTEVVDVLVAERDRIALAMADLQATQAQLDHIIAVALEYGESPVRAG